MERETEAFYGSGGPRSQTEYLVRAPLAGVLSARVHAMSPESAKREALERFQAWLDHADWSTCGDNPGSVALDEALVLEQVVDGPFFYGPLDEAEVSEIDDKGGAA